MRRGFFNIGFRAPSVSWPPVESWPRYEITADDIWYYFERYGGTRYRLNRAYTSYGEITPESMYMNFGYRTFSGYTISGGVSGIDSLNQTRFTMNPTSITLKSKGSDHFRITDHARVLTYLVVDNSTYTKTLTTEFDTTTNTLSVKTFTWTNTLSVHEGTSTRFLNVSTHTNTNTLSAKFLTTTQFISTLSGTYSNYLDVLKNTNTETLSVEFITFTDFLSTLSGTYSNYLDVLKNTNTETLSVEFITFTDFLSTLSGTYSNYLDVLKNTNTETLSVEFITYTDFLSTLSGTYTNYLDVLKNTNTESLSVEHNATTETFYVLTSAIIGDGRMLYNYVPLSLEGASLDVYGKTITDYLHVTQHTDTPTISTYHLGCQEIEILNKFKIGSAADITKVEPFSEGHIRVNNKFYYSAEVVDHMVQWLSGLGDKIYDWYYTGGGNLYNRRVTMSYPVSSNSAYNAQSVWNFEI